MLCVCMSRECFLLIKHALIPVSRPHGDVVDDGWNDLNLQQLDVNALIEGRPAIHYASDYGQKEVIQYLISKGADVNVSRS